MRFRETNHLRKLANESGKQMRRHRVRPDTRPQLIPDKPVPELAEYVPDYRDEEPYHTDSLAAMERERGLKS